MGEKYNVCQYFKAEGIKGPRSVQVFIRIHKNDGLDTATDFAMHIFHEANM